MTNATDIPRSPAPAPIPAGLDQLRAIRDGELGVAPMQALMNMRLIEAEEGRVVFGGVPEEKHYNPGGIVHGTFTAAMLDSAMGCAVITTLPDVRVLKQGFNVDPLLQKQAACISTMTYNKYWQLIEAGMQPSQLIVFKYSDEGVGTLEDGLYTLQPKLNDPQMVDRLARFLRASMRGWQYAGAS